MVLYLAKKCPAFCGPSRFMNVFTRSTLIHSTQLNSFQINFNIKPPVCPGFLGGLPPSGFPTRTLYAFIFSRPRLLEYPNNVGQCTYEAPHYAFVPSHLHFLTLRTKCLPRHSILEHPQPVFFLE